MAIFQALEETQAPFASLGEESRVETTCMQGNICFAAHEDMATVEREWRAFEQIADGTAFQSFDWLSTWQKHIGTINKVAPAIITGRDNRGRLLFLLPLAVECGGFARRLTWLGTDLCDYNGPLLAPDYSERVDSARFIQIWREIMAFLRSHPNLWFDLVYFEKMQNVVGTQSNPFMGLGVMPHPNGAYLTRLTADWEKFYADKRSSDTRRRDRTKRRKLGEFGEIRFVTPAAAGDVAATLDKLIEQKSKAFATMGVVDIFALPGHRAFYHALAAKRDIAHVSRLDVGAQVAAANLALIFRGSYYHLLASYDGGELSKFGPGAAHMRDLLRYAIEQGCGTYDFTIGDERYKQEWCDTQITLFDHVSPATLCGRPFALRLYLEGRLKRFVKQSPVVWNAIYKLRMLIGPLMRKLRR